MKIKKKTSVMMIAAATAAVVGVAAVSFAAWSGSGVDEITANAATGNITYSGFVSDAELKLTDGLVPYDQGEGVTVVHAEIPEYYVYGQYDITVAATSEAELTLYAIIDENATVETPENLDNWTKISVEDGAVLLADTTSTTADEATSVTGKYLHIILDSSNYEEHHNQSYTITVTFNNNAV